LLNRAIDHEAKIMRTNLKMRGVANTAQYRKK
jgi:hypothetical protein